MLPELPGLAGRLKAFVRDNPLKEAMCGEGPTSGHMAALVADLFVKASQASRQTFTFEVENTGLKLSDLKSFENRTNTAELPQLPGLGPGLLRVLGFRVGRSWASYTHRIGHMGMFVEVEHSPLGWPDLPDMAEADLNVLFEEPGETEAEGGWRNREPLL